jgi:hypothetical protein
MKLEGGEDEQTTAGQGPAVLYVDLRPKGVALVRRHLDGLVPVVAACSLDDVLSALRSPRVWAAFLMDPIGTGGPEWEMMARARRVQVNALALVYSGTVTDEVMLRARREKMEFLHKLSTRREVRDVISRAIVTRTPVRREIEEFTARRHDQLGLTPTEAVIVESDLLGLENGDCSDARHLAPSTVLRAS